jgi:hypothetical protein
MSIWAIATEVAIWTLIVGSVAVFGWFLAEVARLASGRRASGGRRTTRHF